MSNLTVVIDDALLKAARIKAVQEDTSVNEICRKAIEAYVGRSASAAGEDLAARLRASIERAARRPASSPPAWPGREAIYEERMQELEQRRQKVKRA
jgi:hypothetical protein